MSKMQNENPTTPNNYKVQTEDVPLRPTRRRVRSINPVHNINPVNLMKSFNEAFDADFEEGLKQILDEISILDAPRTPDDSPIQIVTPSAPKKQRLTYDNFRFKLNFDL
jgi:hypothetical protein